MMDFNRLAALAALLALLAQPAAAIAAEQCRGPEGLAAPGPELPLVPNEFLRTGERGLGCVLPPDQPGQPPRPHATDPFQPCLRIGPVTIGDRLDAVETLLGPPAKITPLSNNVEARAYFIRQRSQPPPYFIVTALGQRVVAVQLFGPPAEMPLTFSSLALGDSPQRVLDVLGPPSRRGENRERGFDTWYYPPFPIAVDMGAGHVVGLKVSVPVERNREE